MSAPNTPDPWKGFRGVCAGTLVLEAIVMILTLPVIAQLGGGITVLSGLWVGVATLAMILGAGVQGRPWAMNFNVGLQVFVLIGAVADLSIGAVGLIFGVVWGYLAYLQRDLRAKIARGQLPAQQ